MQYQSETPFINVNLDANCLSIEFNRPDALNALRPDRGGNRPEFRLQNFKIDLG